MMKKELIILKFLICVEGITKQQAEQQIWHLMDFYKFEDLEDNYIVKQIWLPTKGETDVEVIYPVSGILDAKLIKEVEDVVKKYPDSPLTKNLNGILREIKLYKAKNN